MKTYRNHHTRNRTRRRGMKGGSYADDLALVTKYSEIGSRAPLNPLDMRPSDDELSAIDRIIKSYPINEDLKVRMLSTLTNVGRTANRGAGYGQQITRQLATRFAQEISQLKVIVETNRPAERNANNDFYLPLQRLHRIAYDYSNNLTPADQAKLSSNKTQYDTVKAHTDGKQPVDQNAANVELLNSVRRFVPELGEWFIGLSRLKNVQIIARPAERVRLFALLPLRLRSSDELAKIFDAYSARIADLYVDISTSVPLGTQATITKPEKPGRKVIETRPIPPPSDRPLPPSPPESRMAEPLELPPPIQLSEARPLVSGPLQEVSAPPVRSTLGQTVSPGLLQSQSTPLASEAQKQFLKGSYQSLQQSDSTKTVCENRYPTVYSLLQSGKFNGSDIISLLNSNDPKVLDLFTAIGYDREAKTIMGHPIAEIYRACHPDRGITDQDNLTRIFQVLKALESFTGSVQPVLSLPSILKLTSKAAAQPGGPGSKPEKPGMKTSAMSSTGDLSGVFKRGDRLRPRAIMTDPETGDSVILTVAGDYDPRTKTIQVTYRGQSQTIPVDVVAKEFQVIQERVQKRLFKKDDRVLIKNPKKLTPIDRTRGAIGCDEPFYATVMRDQEPSITYVSIKCDSGDRYSADEEQLIYIPPGPALLSRSIPGSISQQPAPVAPLADSSASVKRGELQDPKAFSNQGTPANITDCDRKLVGMTHRATTCEANVAELRAELAKAIAKNQADNDRLQADISREQGKLSDLQSSKDEIESDLAALRKKKDLMQGYLNDFGGQLKEVAKIRSDLEEEKGKLEDTIATLQSDKAQNDAQTERNIQQIAELRKKVEATSKQQSTLQGQYAEAQAKLLSAEASVADLNSRFATTDALIRSTDERIRTMLISISGTLTDGIEQITDGISYVAGLADDTRTEIVKSRTSFTEQFGALQRQLAAAELARRTEILDAIRSLKEENQRGMAVLQKDLATASAEKDRLQALYSQEQAAKAQAEGRLAAKNDEITRKDQEHAIALEAARQAATATAEQVKTAETAAEISRLQLVYHSRLDDLSNRLAAAVSRAQVAEGNNKERAALAEELDRVRASIAALPAPYVAPVAPEVVAPVITGREPPVGTPAPQGSSITIQWDPRGTPAPWILRIDYDGTNPDFQEITAEGPIVYTVKRPGALSGRIYSVTVV